MIPDELSVSAKSDHHTIFGGRKEGQAIDVSEHSVASGLQAIRKNWYLPPQGGRKVRGAKTVRVSGSLLKCRVDADSLKGC